MIERRLSVRDRVMAWLLAGPIGRLVAFLGDLGAAWLRWGAAKVRRRQ